MISGIDLKIDLLVDHEPACLLRYQIRAITARLQQLLNGHATVHEDAIALRTEH
jgi:hypothetical protein